MSRIALGVAQGLEKASQYMLGFDEREARRKEALAMQQLAEQKLQSSLRLQPAREELELAQLKQQIRQVNAQSLQTITFQGFRLYDADGDTRHLNNWLTQAKQNPIGSSIYDTTVRIDPLTNTTENTQLLRQAGYQDVEGIYNNKDISKNLVTATMTDGSRKLLDMRKVQVMTGYTRDLRKQELQQKEREARIHSLLTKGQTVDATTQRERVVESLMKDKGISRPEAYQKVLKMEQGSRESGEMQAISQVQEETGLSFLDAAEQYFSLKGQSGYKSDKERYVERYLTENPEATPMQAEQAYAARTPTSQQKETGDIEAAKATLDELNFFEKSMRNLPVAERAKIHNQIARIEDLRGVSLSTEDKRIARDFRSLTSLGKTVADELTPDETGILDSTLHRFKNYLVNEVGGKKATSAYETFRGIFRNALYGASLTDNEIKAFNAAAGTLGQKFKPALQAFKTQVETMKSKMEAIRDTNDPYLAHFYFGSDIDQLDEVIRQLETRLDTVAQTITASQPAAMINSEAEPIQDGGTRPSLADLYKGVKP